MRYVIIITILLVGGCAVGEIDDTSPQPVDQTTQSLASSQMTKAKYGIATWTTAHLDQRATVTGSSTSGETLARFELNPTADSGLALQSTYPSLGVQYRDGANAVRGGDMTESQLLLFDAFIHDISSAPTSDVVHPGATVVAQQEALDAPQQCYQCYGFGLGDGGPVYQETAPLWDDPSCSQVDPSYCVPPLVCDGKCDSASNYDSCEAGFVKICHKFSNCNDGTSLQICDSEWCGVCSPF
jgi:hypothetical protein